MWWLKPLLPLVESIGISGLAFRENNVTRVDWFDLENQKATHTHTYEEVRYGKVARNRNEANDKAIAKDGG